jgi:integrase
MVIRMPTRRRRRGYIGPLPSGSFRAVVYAGVDPLTGGRHNITETSVDYDAAERALSKLLNQVDENKHPKSAITVAEAVPAGTSLG